MDIYEVTVSKKIYMVADQRGSITMRGNTHRAVSAAKDDDGEWNVDARQVTKLSEVPEEWHDGIPYGEHEGDTTIEQFLARSGK